MSKKLKDYVCLVGIDERSESETAFDFYIKTIHRPTNKVVLVHACEPFILSSNDLAVTIDGIRARALTDEKMRMKNLQEKYEEKMKANGVKGRINIIYYSQQPGKIICQIAKEDKCSLIVIGCRDAEPDKLRRYGETVDYVMKKADCPVVLARRKTVPGLAEQSGSRRGSQSISTKVQQSKLDDKVERQRRISLPAKLRYGVQSTPSAAVGSDPVAGGTPSSSSSPSNAADARQRRHSSIANPISTALKNPTGGKRLSTRPEEPELELLVNKLGLIH